MAGGKTYKVALVGQPNVGKSSLFTRLTGVGVISSNYPGTTVEFDEGVVTRNGKTVSVHDLPGTYSLSGNSDDEKVVLRDLWEGRNDTVVLVADATNLVSSLVLCFETLELGLPTIIALTKMDEARKRNRIDIDALARTSADAASSSLQNVAPTVTGIYEEESGLGYAVTLSTTEGYTGEPMEFVMAVDTEGKIVGTALTAYPETKDFGADYPATYIGQDSALADATLVAGVTYSSAAFKNAVTDGFTTLIENGLVKEGVKGDDQLLLELLPTEFTGMANPEGVLQAEEVEGPACAVKTLKALNGSGFAFLIPNGESYVMAMVNAFGTIKITDAVGNAVDVDAIAEVLDFAAANQESTEKADLKKLTSLAPDGIGEMTALKLDTFGCVTAAYAIEFGEETLYGFRATPFAYANETVGQELLARVRAVADEGGAGEVGARLDDLLAACSAEGGPAVTATINEGQLGAHIESASGRCLDVVLAIGENGEVSVGSWRATTLWDEDTGDVLWTGQK